jgi:hypothetical protein
MSPAPDRLVPIQWLASNRFLHFICTQNHRPQLEGIVWAILAHLDFIDLLAAIP